MRSASKGMSLSLTTIDGGDVSCCAFCIHVYECLFWGGRCVVVLCVYTYLVFNVAAGVESLVHFGPIRNPSAPVWMVYASGQSIGTPGKRIETWCRVEFFTTTVRMDECITLFIEATADSYECWVLSTGLNLDLAVFGNSFSSMFVFSGEN